MANIFTKTDNVSKTKSKEPIQKQERDFRNVTKV